MMELPEPKYKLVKGLLAIARSGKASDRTLFGINVWLDGFGSGVWYDVDKKSFWRFLGAI